MSKSKTFGYVRVSTRDQNIDRQLVAMHEIGIDERDIFIEKASGKNFIRPQYQALKAQLREGDILYITSLDRLGRNSNEIESEWDELTQKIGIDIVVLDMPLLDTTQYKDDLGNFVAKLALQIFSFIAQNEREKTLIRQKEGIAVAKAKGKHLGRPQINLSTLTDEQKTELIANYQTWKDKRINSVKFMKKLQLTKNTFYKIMKEYEKLIRK